MIIQVDKEGKDVIEQFCDMALKQGGLQNFNQVDLVLHTVKLLPVPVNKKKGKKGKGKGKGKK